MQAPSDASPRHRAAGPLGPAARALGERLLLGALPVAVVLTMLAVAHGSSSIAADFRHEIYPQAELIVSGTSPYPDPGSDLTGTGNYVWPPLVAYIASPFTLLPVDAATLGMALLGLCCFAGALWIAGARDWRVYGAFGLWAPVVTDIRTGHLTAVLCLLVAVAWRTRDRRWAPGLAVGIAVAMKFLLWPLALWLAALGRRREAVLAAIGAAGSLLLLLPFVSITEYARLLRSLGEAFDQDSYSAFGILAQSGVDDFPARALTAAVGAGMLVLAWRRRSLAMFVATALVLSPIVWLDYYALLAVPLAVVRPTFSWIWLVPVATWGLEGAGHGIGEPAGTLRVLVTFAVVVAYVVRREQAPVGTNVAPAVPGLAAGLARPGPSVSCADRVCDQP